MNRDVDAVFLQRADVDHGPSALTDTKERIGCQIGIHYSSEDKGQAGSQELFHDVPPVAVCRLTGVVHGFKDFMVGRDRHDIQIFPDLLSLGRCAVLDGLIFFIRFGT